MHIMIINNVDNVNKIGIYSKYHSYRKRKPKMAYSRDLLIQEIDTIMGY